MSSSKPGPSSGRITFRPPSSSKHGKDTAVGDSELAPHDSASQAQRTSEWVRQDRSEKSAHTSLLKTDVGSILLEAYSFKESDEHKLTELNEDQKNANTYTPQCTGLI